jgi:hypothetical protein
MTGKPLRTGYRLWTLAAISTFVALGFVDMGKGGESGDGLASLWSSVGRVLTLWWIGYKVELGLDLIICQVLFWTVPAVLVGWVLQALMVAGWTAARDWFAASKSVTPASEK